MKKFILLLLAAISCVAVSAQRTYLIQTEWDQTNYNSLLPKFNDSTAVYSGCTTVAAAQVINFYGWLPEYTTRFELDVTDSVSGFPAGAVEKRDPSHNVWQWSGTFHVDSMPMSPDSLIRAIFYSEASMIERTGTMTSPYVLYGSFNNHYSYDVEAYVTNAYSNAEELNFCQVISTAAQKDTVKAAIAAGKPVIVNGLSHTFIIDGYDSVTDEFHFNLGWGPGQNFWGDYGSWADGRYSIFIVTPNRTKEVMPEIAYGDSIPLHMRNIATGVDHLAYINDDKHFRFEDDFDYHIEPGSYEMWIDLPGGQILAPRMPSNSKVLGDGVLGITSYSFMHDKAILHVADPGNYGLLVHASIAYDTQMGYLDMRFRENISEEALDTADMRVSFDGMTYRIVKQVRDYHTVPIRMKRNTLVKWLASFQGLSFGNVSDSHYQDALLFDEEDKRIVLIPSNTLGPNDYVADHKDQNLSVQASIGGFYMYNSTNPFSMVTPSMVYKLDEENYDYYSGWESIIPVVSDYVYMGFVYATNGAHMFVYNRLPQEYDFETGVAYIMDDSITTYALAPGSPIPAAPEAPNKLGYTFVGWEPMIGPDTVVANTVMEYHALYRRGNYEFYESLNALITKGEPKGQMVVVEFDDQEIDSIGVSVEGVRNGVRISPWGYAVNLSCDSVPTEWEAGGFVKGKALGEWKVIDGVWTLSLTNWDNVVYSAKPPFESGRYYIYNEGAQAYMNYDTSSDTQAVVEGAGGNSWLSREMKEYFLSFPGGALSDRIYFEEAGDSTYYLKTREGSYYYWAGGAGEHGDDVLSGVKDTTAAYKWRLSTPEERQQVAVNADVTYYITNPDFSLGSKGWMGNWDLPGADAEKLPYYTGKYAQKPADSIGSVVLKQSITLPKGRYRLTVSAQSVAADGTADTTTCLFVGKTQTALGLLGTYSIEFNTSGQALDFGIKNEAVGNSQLSLDQVRLEYLGEPVAQFPTMTITYNSQTRELTLTPSDPEAYYMQQILSVADITRWNYDVNKANADIVHGFGSFELVKSWLRRGEMIISMDAYAESGLFGDYIVFTNFVDTTSLLVSETTQKQIALVDFPTMTISYNNATQELTFTPSNKEAYYLAKLDRQSNSSVGINADSYFVNQLEGCSNWADMLAICGSSLCKGDRTFHMADSLALGLSGKWRAFANFIDSASVSLSKTTKTDFMLVNFPTMTISYNPQTLDLSFTPSDKSAYYMATYDMASYYASNWSTLHSSMVFFFPIWEDLVAFSMNLYQGDKTFNLSRNLAMGDVGDYIAFTNFIDQNSLLTSETTRFDFVLAEPVVTAADEVKANEQNNAIYDVLGRKVNHMMPGHIYIVGGKKYLHR